MATTDPEERTASFGYWLRRHRKARDLTQAQLAERANCSRAMVRKVEADERRPSDSLAHGLATALGLTATERTVFLAAARADLAVDRLPLPDAPIVDRGSAGSLPLPATPLHGRTADLALLLQHLRDPACRCITLIGPGGVGKTRLAIAALEALITERKQFAWFIPLATINRPELVLTTIALTLGLRGNTPADQLRTWPQLRQAILVLDTLEHLVAAAEDLAQLLADIPGLRLLITSRAPLRIAAEQLVEVPPLALPPERPGMPITTTDLAAAPATAFFLERCAALRMPDIVSPEECMTVAQIVRKLDGLPLAIELAAARTRLLPLRDVLTQLNDRLDLLSDGRRDLPPRQRTLRDIVHWSYALVDPEARTTFARLAVFAGGFTLPAAAAVDPYPGLIKRLTALQDASLIRRVEDRPDRFAMLDTIAEYARERLAESGESADLYARHASWCLALGATAEQGLCGAQRLEWIKRLEAELPNLRVALAWAIHARHNPREGVLLVSRIRQFWHVRGLHREGRDWLSAGLSHVDDADEEACGAAWLALGYLCWFQREYAEAVRALERATTRLRTANLPALCAEALALQAIAILSSSQHEEQAMAAVHESLHLARQVGAAWTIGMAHFWNAVVAGHIGSNADAATHAYASIAAFAEAGDAWNGGPHSILGDLAIAADDQHSASMHYQTALACFRAIGDVWGCAFSLRTLAELALRAGRIDEAYQCVEESIMHWHALGDQRAGQHSARLLAEMTERHTRR